MKEIKVKHLNIVINLQYPKELTKEQVEVIRKDLLITCVRIKNKLS